MSGLQDIVTARVILLAGSKVHLLFPHIFLHLLDLCPHAVFVIDF